MFNTGPGQIAQLAKFSSIFLEIIDLEITLPLRKVVVWQRGLSDNQKKDMNLKGS
jgi:hypothetical protein